MTVLRPALVLLISVGMVFFAFARDWAFGSQAVEVSVSSPASLTSHASIPAGYQNPVLQQNFPDPQVIAAEGGFYVYATNSNRSNIRAARSTDLVNWTPLSDALPRLGPWVQPLPNMVWAPEVIKIGANYRMYYTARDRASNRQCIGVASSQMPDAAFEDVSQRPLICPPGYERAIDASPFASGKQVYLYFSGVCCDRPNGIFVQRLSADGLSTVGSPSLLIEAVVPWEGTVVEAPTMLKHAGKYYLFYSGNDYRDGTYAVGYATCKSPLGPCVKAAENPILATGSPPSSAIGPGHQSIVQVGKQFWLIYHAWYGVAGYDRGGSRTLWLNRLNWQDGKPVVMSPPTEEGH